MKTDLEIHERIMAVHAIENLAGVRMVVNNITVKARRCEKIEA